MDLPGIKLHKQKGGGGGGGGGGGSGEVESGKGARRVRDVLYIGWWW